MADAVTSIQSNQAAFNAAQLQLAESAILNNAITQDNTSVDINAIDNNGFNSNLLQAASDVPLPHAANSNSAEIGAEGLLGLNNTTLSLFNEIGNAHLSTDPQNLDVTGNLSGQQLQELGILRQDVQLLEEASVLGTHIPLNQNAASTLDLSVQAQGIAASTALTASATAIAGLNTPAQSNTTLTQAQVAVAAQIVLPFLNQPLTPALVVQLQDQLQANQINPVGISLSTLLLVQNYLVNPQSVADVEANQEEEAEISVDPVSSVDAVAVEDSAIL